MWGVQTSAKVKSVSDKNIKAKKNDELSLDEKAALPL